MHQRLPPRCNAVLLHTKKAGAALLALPQYVEEMYTLNLCPGSSANLFFSSCTQKLLIIFVLPCCVHLSLLQAPQHTAVCD